MADSNASLSEQLLVDDFVAADTRWRAEISLPAVGAAFRATLVREDRRWFDDDPLPDVDEHVLCEREFAVSLPTLFAAVDEWLLLGHKLRVLPHSWTPCESGPDVGVALLLEGSAVPVHPVVAGPLGCWG